MAAADSRGTRWRPGPYALVAAAAILPRLAVLLHERGEITAAYVDKGDDFARTFLASGTYGFIPGVPSAYTQPLYGFFLVPLYGALGRSWITVGLAHLALAVATALLVYELGRRFVSPRAGLIAALLVALHPYLVWHDMHMNREVLDQLLAVAVVLVALVLARRPSPPLGIVLGGLAGLAVLGNVRLVLLPLLLAGLILAWGRRPALVPAVAVLAAAALVVSPWVVRNRLSVGCASLTTDARAFWKANNAATLRTLQRGGWIDDVPGIPGAPPTPQDAGRTYRRSGRVLHTDECGQMRFYRRRALAFIGDHPGEKAKLAGVATRMLWQPAVTRTEGRRAAGTSLDTARSWVEPAYMIVVYALGLVGVALLPRRVAALALVLLAYNALVAMLFAGETRYRVPWDFLVALAAAVAVVRLAERVRAREPGRSLGLRRSRSRQA